MEFCNLDFRFGWRWLLPVRDGDTCRFVGFSNEEVRFWCSVIPLEEVVGTRGDASVLIIKATGREEHAPLSDVDLAMAQVVALVVDRSFANSWFKRLVRIFPQISEYALLPAGNSRVVIPLKSRFHAITGLCLHRPGRWLARVALNVVSLLAKVGIFWPLRKRVLLVAQHSSSRVPYGAVKSDWRSNGKFANSDFALYLGTEDNNRKTVILPIGAQTPCVILKAGTSSRARESLRNEASVLRALALSELAEFVPKLEYYIDTADTTCLYQEYRSRKMIPVSRINREVVNFLGHMSRVGRAQSSLKNALASTLADLNGELIAEHLMANGAVSKVISRLSWLASNGTQLLLHRSHGDLAPWNCAWTDKGLFVFDWEISLEQDLALSDAFYYVIKPNLLLKRNVDTVRLLSDVRLFARSVALSGGLVDLDHSVYLALWLLKRVGHAPIYLQLISALEQNWPCPVD